MNGPSGGHEENTQTHTLKCHQHHRRCVVYIVCLSVTRPARKEGRSACLHTLVATLNKHWHRHWSSHPLRWKEMSLRCSAFSWVAICATSQVHDAITIVDHALTQQVLCILETDRLSSTTISDAAVHLPLVTLHGFQQLQQHSFLISSTGYSLLTGQLSVCVREETDTLWTR